MEKEGSLYYLIIQGRSSRQIAAGYKIAPDEWDGVAGEIRLRNEDDWRRRTLTEIQKVISENLRRIRMIIAVMDSRDSAYSAGDIANAYRKPNPEFYFMEFMRCVIARMKHSGKIRVCETYTSALNSLSRFRRGTDLVFGEITRELMADYEIYLREGGVTPNTSSFYMRNLRAVFNRAVESGLTVQTYPFRHIYTGVEKTAKRALRPQAVKKLSITPAQQISPHDFARDMFMFSFYTRGMAFVDMSYLRKTDLKNGILTYRRKKTGQTLSIKWEKCMQEIIDRYSLSSSPYLLPIITTEDSAVGRRQYLTASHRVNRHLNELGRRLDFPGKLTMYVARHTWASIARSRKIPLPVISEALGHDSENTTRIYLASLDRSVIDEANRLVIDGF